MLLNFNFYSHWFLIHVLRSDRDSVRSFDNKNI